MLTWAHGARNNPILRYYGSNDARTLRLGTGGLTLKSAALIKRIKTNPTEWLLCACSSYANGRSQTHRTRRTKALLLLVLSRTPRPSEGGEDRGATVRVKGPDGPHGRGPLGRICLDKGRGF